MYKKLDPSDKANYRPVSVLPLLSKVFEKIIYDQLYEYLEYLVILRFSKSTCHATCSLQANSETACRTRLAGLRWHSFNGFF